MRGAGLNASWSGVIPTMGLSVPVVMDPLCGIARGCDDLIYLRPATATTTTATVGDVRMQYVSVLTNHHDT